MSGGPAESRKTEGSLAGLRVGISISGGEHLAGLGLTDANINEATRRLSEALLARGSAVVFGHDWRPQGVMAEVFRLALDYGPVLGPPRLINYLPWPRRPSVPEEELRRVAGVLEVRPMEQPAGVQSGVPSPEATAMALTEMRRVLAEECHARICLGGKMTSFEGWMPGVAEEAFLTLHAARKHRESGGRALYLSALFGGAAAGLIEAIEGRTWDERLALPAREQHESLLGSRLEDRYRAAGELQEFLRSEGMRLLVECNGLSVEENRALFAATDLETVVVLVLRGLSAVAERRRP